MKGRELLQKVVDAWESLPGGRSYSMRDIQRWLDLQMKPVLDEVREELKQMKREA